MRDLFHHIVPNWPSIRYVIAFDTETTMLCPIGFPANPAYQANDVVLAGWQFHDLVKNKTHDIRIANNLTPLEKWLKIHGNETLLVGHNIKFDLSYLFRTLDRKHVPYVWDTGLYQYLHSGQKDRNPSLEYTAGAWGVPFTKDDKIKKYFESNTVPPEHLLKPYLYDDVDTTFKLFEKQSDDLDSSYKTEEFERLFWIQNRALQMYQYMEEEGTVVDTIELDLRRSALVTDIKMLKDLLYTSLGKIFDLDESKDVFHLNPTAPRTISAVLYHTPVKYKKSIHDGFYKNGNARMRLTEFKPTNKFTKYEARAERNKLGWYGVDEDSLQELRPNIQDTEVKIYIENILKLRKLEKLKGTYYDNYAEQVQTYGRPVVHPNINQTTTKTGRTSCSNPNLQNSPAEAEEVLFGKGKLAADFKQVEVCALAELTRDPVLISDLNSGVDIHTEIGVGAGLSRDKVQNNHEVRRKVKSVVFGLIYGGGAKKLSKQSGLPKPTVIKIINAFFKRYNQVQSYYEGTEDNLDHDCSMTTSTDGVVESGIIELPTGRNLYLEKELSMYTRTQVWPYTKIRNYPVQSTAGDWQAAFLALVYTYMVWFDNENNILEYIKPVMTVHDSLKFERMGNLTGTLMSNKDEKTLLKVLGEDILPEFIKWWTGTMLSVPLVLEIEE